MALNHPVGAVERSPDRDYCAADQRCYGSVQLRLLERSPDRKSIAPKGGAPTRERAGRTRRSGLLTAIALLFTVHGFQHTLHNPGNLM